MIKGDTWNWRFIPLIFGGLSLCVVIMGIFVSHYLSNEYTTAIEINQRWTAYLEEVDELHRFAGEVNLPGNDVFDTKNPDKDVKHFETALHRFNVKLEMIQVHLARENVPLTRELSESIARVQGDIADMSIQERSIFENFKKGNFEEATRKMALMDREYINVRESIFSVRRVLRGMQNDVLREQREHGQNLRKQEIFFIFTLGLIAILVITYGARLSRLVSKANHLFEQKRKALDVSSIVIIVNPLGKIVYVNKNLLRLSGYSQEELEGKNYRDFNSDESFGKQFDELWRSMSAKKVWRGEFKNHSKSGRPYWVNSTVVPLLDENGELDSIVDVQFDITDSKQIQADLVEAKTQAELAHATKARFLANMSHEIRTPMNGIIGMTSLLMDFTKDPLHLERLKIIQNCGNSLLDLINDVLDFSKLEVDKVELENEPFDVHATAKEVVELLGTRASEKGIPLNYLPDAQMPTWIKGDVTRFRQILTNLVSNALKFTEKGGVKILSSAKKSDDGHWLVEFAVKDTGIGIPPELRDRLFQSFSQVDASTTRRFGGTGLGLVISKGLCEKMGGTIRVESEVGKGSTFFFSMKVSEVIETHLQKTQSVPSEYDETMGKAHPLRILVAEDNRTNQLVILGLLGKFGYQADIASDGKQVLEQLEKKNYDLIFMDSHMPEMDGFAATREIIKRFDSKSKPRPKIISLSASTMKQDIDKCFESGMDGFVGKPITIAALIKTLSHCQSSGSHEANFEKVNKQMQKKPSTVFDSKTFLERFAGLEALAHEAIGSFLEMLPGLMEDLEKALKNHDSHKIEISAHTIKGSVVNFCAESCRDLAFQIEEMSHQKDFQTSEAMTVFNKLKKELDLLKIELNEFCAEKKSA